jgi:hypothetical protein
MLATTIIKVASPILLSLLIVQIVIWGLRTIIAAETRNDGENNLPRKKKNPTELMIESFTETLNKIKSKLIQNQMLSGNNLVEILENDRISFHIPYNSNLKPSILEYPSLELLKSTVVTKRNLRNHNRIQIGQMTMSERKQIIELGENKTYSLSAKEFDQFCGSRFNVAFRIRMDKIIELSNKKELQPKMSYLIPRYEISFNTLLNVINEQLNDNKSKVISKTMEDKIFFIIESFEKELQQVEESRYALEILEAEALEKSLEEQLEFEVKYIEKVKTDKHS